MKEDKKTYVKRDTMLKKLMKELKEVGYCVWHYPRLKEVSINGGRRITEREAIKEMKRMLNN